MTEQFCVKTNLSIAGTIPKRAVNSDFAPIFDPLGILSPVVIKAKIFVQQL